MENTMKNNFDNTMVGVIDADKLNTHVSEFLGRPVKVRSIDGVIDTEHAKGAFDQFNVVGSEVEESQGEMVVESYVYDSVDGGISMFPSGKVGLTIAELQPFVTKEVTLREFLGDRFNYNARIEGNQRAILGWINGK